MKLAEALNLKKNLERDADKVESLILKCCLAQNGETPPFDPNELFKQYEEIDKLIVDITIKIQRSNNQIKFTYDDKDITAPLRSMTQAIADIDDLKRQIELINDIISNGIVTKLYSAKKIAEESNVDVVAYYKTRRHLYERLDKLKLRVQSANWEFDLID